MIFGTVTTTSHLPKAFALAKSIKSYMPTSKIVVCLIEEAVPDSVKKNNYFDEIVLAKNISTYDNFYKFIFQYEVSEGAWCCKPMLLNYLINHYDSESMFIYLDTDMKIYGSFEDLFSYYKKSPILLTPHHHFSPEPFDYFNYDRLKSDGIFNAGFVAVSKNDESINFVNWWMRRVEQMGYVDRQKKMYSDQTWLDFAPSFFDVHVLRLPEYNVGPWNFYQRKMTTSNDQYLVDGKPLKLFHFSGVYNNYFEQMLQYTTDDQKSIIYKMYIQYLHELEELGIKIYQKSIWSYDLFLSGEKIDPQSRKVYRSDQYINKIFDQPFHLSNRLFKSFIKNNNIYERRK